MQSSSSFMNKIRFNFLYIDKYSFGRTWIYPESAIPYSMLRYVIDGSAEFMVDDEIVIVKKGQVAYIPESCRLSCRALGDAFSFYSIRFTTSVFYEGANFLREYYNFPLVMDVGEEIEAYFSTIYKWVRTEKRSRVFHVRGALDSLIASLIDILNPDEPGDVKGEINSLEYNLEQIRTRIYHGTEMDGAIMYGKPGKKPPMWLHGIMYDEMEYFNGIMHGAQFDDEFKPLLTGEAARNAIATADACTRSRFENRKVKLSEITEG